MDRIILGFVLPETGIDIDWSLDESVWRAAGRAFQAHALRRGKQHDPGPRRILPDFLIGTHALEGGHSLLTLDDHLYRIAFPIVEKALAVLCPARIFRLVSLSKVDLALVTGATNRHCGAIDRERTTVETSLPP
jgi:hypothetical protein